MRSYSACPQSFGLGCCWCCRCQGLKKFFFPTAKSWHSFWRDTRYFSLLWLETNYPTFLRRLRFTLQCSWSKALDFPDRTSGPLVVACSGTEKSICYTLHTVSVTLSLSSSKLIIFSCIYLWIVIRLIYLFYAKFCLTYLIDGAFMICFTL